MDQDRAEHFVEVTGEEIRPSLGKLWGMLVLFLLMIPFSAWGAYCWWTETEVLGGIVLSAKAGIAGLLGVPIGVFLALVMVALIASAKRLVIGDDCVQLLSGRRVAVHIPY